MPIYDNSYRRIEGARSAGRLRFLPIAVTGLRLFFRRRLPKILLVAALFPFMGMLFFRSAPFILQSFEPERLGGELLSIFHLSGTGLYLYLVQMEWVFFFIFTVLIGGGLIANDLRANALEIYFSRPLTLTDYFLGKLLVVQTILFGLAFIPSLLLWLVDISLTEADGYWIEQLHLIPRLLGASILITLPYGMIMLAISSVARTARTAMVVFAGLVIMTSIFGRLLEEFLEQPMYAMVSIDYTIQRLMAVVLQPEPELLHAMLPPFFWKPNLDVSAGWSAVVLGGWIVACLFVFYRRVRAVEVVSA